MDAFPIDEELVQAASFSPLRFSLGISTSIPTVGVAVSSAVHMVTIVIKFSAAVAFSSSAGIHHEFTIERTGDVWGDFLGSPERVARSANRKKYDDGVSR